MDFLKDGKDFFECVECLRKLPLTLIHIADVAQCHGYLRVVAAKHGLKHWKRLIEGVKCLLVFTHRKVDTADVHLRLGRLQVVLAADFDLDLE